MEEERKLSEVFKDICNQLENGAKIVESKTNDEIDRFMVKLENFDNLLISDKVSQLGTKKNFVVSDKFISDIEYIKSYLIMCEQMLAGRVPSLNPFNKAKFNEFKDKKIILAMIDKNNYGVCDVKDTDLLEDEYYNVRYKIGTSSNFTQQINTTNNFENKFDNIENSPIQIGNYNNQENTLNSTGEVIKLSVFKKILNFLKKIIVFVIANVTTIAVSVVSSVLTVIILNKLGLN